MSFASDLLSQSEWLEKVPKLSKGIKAAGSTVGRVAGVVSYALTVFDVLKQYNDRDYTVMNNLVDRLVGNNLTGLSRDEVIAKYAYSFAKISDYVESGDVSFSADWNGQIKSYSYDADLIDSLKQELEVLELIFR